MNSETKIGIFVIMAALVVAYFIIRTDEDGNGLKFWSEPPPTRTIEAVVDDASGVRESTVVRIAGVKVGKVLSVNLKGGKAVITLAVEPDLDLREGARIELQSQGILGEKYVSLDPGSGAVLPEGATITGSSPPSLEDLSKTIQSLGSDLEIIVRNIKESTFDDSGNNRLEAIAANMERMSSILVEIMEENRGDFKSTTGNIASLSQELRTAIPALVAEMSALTKDIRAMAGDNRGRMDETMQNVADLTKKMDSAMASLSSVAGKIDSGQGTIGKLINDDETAGKVDELIDNAGQALQKVQQYIGQADRLKFNLGIQSDYLTEHSASRTTFGLKVSPNDKKYYLIEAFSRDTSYLPGEIHIINESTYDAEGNLITTTVREEEEEEDEFGFSGQLAYRFGDVFLRGGLIEGEGGGGLDYLLLSDRVQLNFDAYDFNRPRDLSARMRFGVQYNLGDTFKLRVGMDDFLESDFRSTYFGLGLTWSDDDLKPLIGSLGSAL